MARTLLDRVKDRVDADLEDIELDAIINGIEEDIDIRVGERVDSANPITRHYDGFGRTILQVLPKIDTTQTVTIVEIDASDDETTLASDDYRITNSGRIVERLSTGTNARQTWENLVKVTYTPVNNNKVRDDVVIKLVELEVEYRGLSNERSGDLWATQKDYFKERERLISLLMPTRGFYFA